MRSGGGLDCAEGGRWGKKMLEWDIYFEGRVKWPCCWLAEGKVKKDDLGFFVFNLGKD